MQDWHFNIEGTIFAGDHEIHLLPENFTNLIRIYDFTNKHMAIALARLSIDKSLLDHITKNAKDATMHLKIGKFLRPLEGDPATVTSTLDSIVEDGYFNLVIENDLAYHDDIDYNDPIDSGGSPYDKYREIHVGLIRKACLDTNKIVENTVVQETSMQDLVLSYMYNAGVHLLIEPFKYNDIQSQLLVPPTDSLTSLIEFLNAIKVFYDSKYVFFIDEPYCTYLVSRSGTGVPMKGEEYNKVIINMHKITETDMVNLGMTSNPDEESYQVDVSVVDSVYTIDHDSAKVVNQISAIVNPSNNNTKDKGENLAKAQNYVDSIMTQFKVEVAKAANAMNNVSGVVKDFQTQFQKFMIDQTAELVNFQDRLQGAVMDHLGQIPTSVSVDIGDYSVSVPIMADGIKSAAQSLFNNQLNIANTAKGLANQVTGKLGGISNNLISESYKMLNIDNKFLSLSNVNAQEVIDDLIKEMGSLPSGFNNILGNLGSIDLSSMSNVLNAISSITSKGEDLKAVLEAVKAGSYYGYIMDQHKDVTQNMDDVIENVSRMNQCASEFSDVVDKANINLDNFKTFASDITKVANSISSYGSSISVLKNFDIKSKFKSVSGIIKAFNNSSVDFNKLSNLDSTVTSILSKNNVMAGLKDIDFKQLAKTAASTIRSISDVTKLKKNLQVFNIDNIGKLGLDNFDAITNFGSTIKKDTKIGVKIMKVRNDNPNEIKTLKAEAETMINRLSFNKFGLDPTVFTPNKKYIVKNYGGHADKDGNFVLNCRTEVYIREDNTFVCNTRLDLAKLPDNTTTEKAQEISKPNTNSTDVKPNKTPSQVQDKNRSTSSNTSILDFGKSSNQSGPLSGRDRNNPFIIH